MTSQYHKGFNPNDKLGVARQKCLMDENSILCPLCSCPLSLCGNSSASFRLEAESFQGAKTNID